MNTLTQQQREEISRFVVSTIRGLAVGDLSPLDQLLDFVDALADARVVRFAQGALLAIDVRAHLENTVEQYALLGHAVHPTGSPRTNTDGHCLSRSCLRGSSAGDKQTAERRPDLFESTGCECCCDVCMPKFGVQS